MIYEILFLISTIAIVSIPCIFSPTALAMGCFFSLVILWFYFLFKLITKEHINDYY